MDNSFIEISRTALVDNFRNIKSLLSPEVKFFAVLKANSYGHGCQQTYEILKDMPEGYAVHSLDEAYYLKELGCKKPILIMGYIPLENIDETIENGFHFVLYNKETWLQAEKVYDNIGILPHIHLKIETGTGRQGISREDVKWFIEKIKQNPKLTPTGLFTHFANIEDTTRHNYAMGQLELFKNIFDDFTKAGIKIELKHTACSAAALLFKKSHFDAVRVGISLYGFWPSRETYLSFLQSVNPEANQFLKPVLSWKTRISQLKDMPKGSNIGYGLSYKTTYDSKIAILPIGYADGFDRRFSNNGYVLIGGERAPVRGRVCMNIIMVDVTHIPDVNIEDEAVLLGSQGKETITTDNLATRINSINYEIVSRISPFIPRYIVG